MSDERDQTAMEQKSATPGTAAEEEDDDDVSSPFDHPAFLPVLLFALSIWFGYDGWINQDPDMLEHTTFNRVGFGLLATACVYYTVQGLRERGDDPK